MTSFYLPNSVQKNHNVFFLFSFRWIPLCLLQVIIMIFLTYQKMLCISLATVWVYTSMSLLQTWIIPLWPLWVSFILMAPSCHRLKCRPATLHVSSKVSLHISKDHCSTKVLQLQTITCTNNSCEPVCSAFCPFLALQDIRSCHQIRP